MLPFLGAELTERALWVIVIIVAVLSVIALIGIVSVFVAHYKVNRRQRRRAELDAQWDPILMEVLWGFRPEADLVDTLDHSNHRQFIGFLFRYGRRVKGRERDALLALAKPFLSIVLHDARSRAPEMRARAIQMLGELTSHEHDGVIAEALNDSSPLVAMTAARALAHHGAVDFAEALVARLSRFELWNRRYMAALLAQLGPAAAPYFRTAFTDSRRSPPTRAIVAETLALLNDLEAADLASQILASATDADLLVATLRLVERVGGVEQLAPVRSLMRSTNPGVRAHAVRTLAVLGGPEDVAVIGKALHDSSTWVALHAARGLKQLNQTHVLEQFAESGHRRSTVAIEVLEAPLG